LPFGDEVVGIKRFGVFDLMKKPKFHEAILYLFGLAYLFFGLPMSMRTEYVVMGVFAVAVGILIRLDISSWILRYLKMVVFGIYLLNFIVLGSISLLIFGSSISSITLTLIFTMLSLLFLSLVYFSYRY